MGHGGLQSWIGVVAVLASLLAGCADEEKTKRSTQVDRLRAEMPAMAGVAQFKASYSDTYGQGPYLSLWMRMTDASEADISAVVARAYKLTDAFPDDALSLYLTVADGAEAYLNRRVDPYQSARSALLLRQLRQQAPAEDTVWYISQTEAPSIEIRGSFDIWQTLAAARAALGDTRISVHIKPTAEHLSPEWTVRFPFEAQQEEQIHGQLAGLPVAIGSLSIEDGRLVSLQVALRDRRTAREDLESVIAATRPTSDHPMRLSWSLQDTNPTDGAVAGSIFVAGCALPRAPRDPKNSGRYAPGAMELEDQLQAEHGTCGR